MVMTNIKTSDLHLVHRPQTFKDVVGQQFAVSQLKAMGRAKQVPHALMFTGPSGCGKTTLARLLARSLKCDKVDLAELNAANSRGIDMVREIEGTAPLSPLVGDVRVWIIDEVHQLTTAAQDAFLKLLEEPPRHVYFFLATTDPQKLKRTIVTRCTEVKVHSLSLAALGEVVTRARPQGAVLGEDVEGRIAEMADGSARKALVLLQQVAHLPPDDQLDTLAKSDVKAQTIDLCRALMNPRSNWAAVAPLVKAIDDEPESVRRMVLGYYATVALGGGKQARRAVTVIEAFMDNFYDSGRAGLVQACYLIVEGSDG